MEGMASARRLRIPLVLTVTALHGAGLGVAASCSAPERPVTASKDSSTGDSGLVADSNDEPDRVPKPDGPLCPTDGAPDFDGCV